MLKKIFRITVLLLIFICTVQFVHAQKTLTLTHPDKDFLRGKELYEREKYGAAMDRFDAYLDGNENTSLLWREEAAYLKALCSVELFNDDAQYQLYSFIKQHPESPLINQAGFSMGKLAYRDRQYGNCLRWLEKVDELDLSEEDRAEYFFIKGYSHFKRKEYAEARVALYEIIDSEDRYASPATYYYSHINYEQKNYETAIKGFLSLASDETFSPITPYYVTQIYYLQKKWDDVIKYAPGLLESVTQKRYAEMVRILGEAYFHEDMYTEAVGQLAKYHEEVTYTQPEDKYMMGFAYYMTEDYEKAIKYFKMVSYGENELAQSALYHMADCYVKTGDKQKARLSFHAASNTDFDPAIKEDALFNYAVVTYELAMDPFNEAIRGFGRYILLYPASERTDEAYNYLVLAFMSTRNYRAALGSLDNIRRMTPDIERSYQRVAFFRGLELFNDLQFKEASNKFDASLEYSQYDRSLKALCYYWKGESQYRLKNYDEAINQYQVFLGSDGSSELNEYVICNYNMGYAEFKKENYRDALNWFRRFEEKTKDGNKRIVADAYNRIGDMYFVDARYQRAIENYNKAIAAGMADVDYALFQKGVSLGIMNRYPEKIEILGRIPAEFPGSTYIPDVLYETGRSYFILLESEKAIPFYKKIIDEQPNSSYVSKALVQLGLIYYNQDNAEESLIHYKRVVNDFPGTPEANNALLGIKNVYVESNRVNEYFSYVQSLGRDLDISVQAQDSLSYMAAENIYLNGDCEGSVTAFQGYIEDYPAGAYLVNAHFYKAECLLKTNNHLEALESLSYIISRPRNIFTEPALLTASRINYDYGNYIAALENYLILEEIAEVGSNRSEAKIGKMRCYYLVEEWGDVIDAARSVLRIDKISDEVVRESQYKIAKAFYAQDRFALALDEFRKVADEVSSEEGAESKYRVAECQYIRKQYENAEETIFEFIDLNTPHQFWMAKSFLLLADLYLARDDNFQALQTLQSIIDYYERMDDGILDLAVRKKMDILKRKEALEGENAEEDLEIEVGSSREGGTPNQ
ncbi:MAG TPA: tetratricopeptide repeat protein [Bacteroides sp.]|nr:tetratricopeptide repeat protein [Bacteroides sp.]